MRRGSVATLAALTSLTVVGTALPATAGAAASGAPATTAPAPGAAVRTTDISAHGAGVMAPAGALSGHGGPAQAALAMIAARHRLAASRARRPATVTGVVRAFTGLPVAGACVTAFGAGGRAAARTTADGRFALRGLRAGRYTLGFRDCARPGRYLPQWSGGAPVPAMARPLQASGGAVTRVAPVTLRPASPAALFARPPAAELARAAGLPAAAAARQRLGGISGKVTGTHGRPVRRTCVEVHFGGGWLGIRVRRDGTYNTGRELPAGTYTVEFAALDCGANPGNWAPQWYKNKARQAAATKVRIVAGKTTRHIDARLKHGGIITGTVTTQAGRRLTGQCVALITLGGDEVFQLGYAHGHYSFRGLPGGRYRVLFAPGCGRGSTYLPQWWKNAPSFRKARTIRVRLGQTVTGIDARLQNGGVISGTVRFRSLSGVGLRGICVDATRGSLENGQDFFAATRKDGTYLIEGLPTGSYSLFFSPGCPSNGNFLDATYPHRIKVTAGKTIGGVSVVLQQGGIISGKVTDSHGRPIAGLGVLAFNADFDGNGVCTSKTGAYSVPQLPPGRYLVEFVNACRAKGNWAPQYYPGKVDPNDAVPVRVRLSQHVSGIDATMRPGSTITGTVTSQAGRPLRGMCVALLPPDEADGFAMFGFFVYDAKTSRTGTYKIADLAPGRYAIGFSGCGTKNYVSREFGGRRRGAPIGDIVTVGAAATVRGIGAVMSSGGTVSGTIRSATGRPLGSACSIMTNLATGTETFGETLGSSGRYRNMGLSAGRYRVEFYVCEVPGPNNAIQWFDHKPSPRAATPVRVRAGHSVRAVNAALPRGGQIAGRLTAAATGKPLANRCVDALSRSGDYFGFGFTGRRGNYVVSGLNSGTYRLTISDCDGAGPSGVVANLRLARTIHVTAPHAVGGVNVALPAGGSVAGTVTAGRPATGQGGVCVQAFPVAPGGVPGIIDQTGFNGRYRLTGLAAGKYKISFGSRPVCDNGFHALVPQWYRHAPTRATATVVTVRAGRTTAGIDATLRHDGGISGVVTVASSGTRLSGICVRVVPATASRTASFTTSASGRYSVTGLLPGRYTVEFRSGCGAAGYATQWWHGAATAAAATVITVRADAVTTGISAAMKR